jgi:hypothetical protein
MIALKDFILHKLTLRVIYIVGAYAGSDAIGFVASPRVQGFFRHVGVMFTVSDPQTFKTSITAGLLIAGEFAFHFFHSTFVLPAVDPKVSP